MDTPGTPPTPASDPLAITPAEEHAAHALAQASNVDFSHALDIVRQAEQTFHLEPIVSVPPLHWSDRPETD